MTDLLTRTPGTRTPVPSGLRRVAAISGSLVGTYAVTSALGVLFWLVAARRFPIGAVGVAGASVAAMLLLGTLGTCGLGTLLIARLPVTSQGQRRVLTRTASAVAGAGGLALAVVVPAVAIHAFGVSDLRSVAGSPGIAALFAVGTGLASVSIVVDQAVLVLGSGNLQLERNTVASVAKLVALVALTAAGETGGMAVFLAWTLGTAVSLPLVAWRTRGGRALAAPGPYLDRRVLRGLGRQAISHHSLNISLQAPLQLLPLFVLVGVSAQSNGVFSTALQVTGVVFALPFAISIALFASAGGRERDILERMRLTLPASLAISVLANLLLFPFAGLLLSLFGTQYSTQGVEILRLLALAGLPFVVKDHYVALRRVQGRTARATAVLVGMAVVELAAAGIGVAIDGVVGLCACWLGALVVEAVVLGRVLLLAARGRSDRDRGLWARVGTHRSPRAVERPNGVHTGVGGVGVVGPPADEMLDDDQPVRSAGWWQRTRRVAGVVGVGPVLVSMSLGLLPITRAVSLSRGAGGASALAQALYVGGLVVIFLPAAVGVLLPHVRSSSRIALALAMMMLLQLTRLVVDPVRFVQHDELSHANGLRLIEQTGRLYGDNPLLPVTSYYPGLEIATDAVHDLTGLGDHASATVVLLAARLVLGLGVLLVVSWLTGSRRIGAAAVIVYACNLQMLVFNAQFSYQTLALPLAVLTVYLLLSRRRAARASLAPAVLAFWAVAASHHLTSLLLLAALLGWAVLDRLLRRRGARSTRSLVLTAAAGALGIAVMWLNPGNPLSGYLGEIADSSITAAEGVVGGGPSRTLFQNSAGVPTAPWERYAILTSLLITLVVLLVAAWRARTLLRARNGLVVLLVLLSLLYPLIPAGHLTVATAEVGDRSAGFVFLGVAFVVAWWFWQRPMRRVRSWALALGTTVVFVGSVVLGAGSITNQLPGAFRVSDDARSVDADNLAAVAWLSTHVPPGSVVYGDRTVGRLAGPYAGEFVVTHIGTGIDASRLLLDPTFGIADLALIREAHIRYLIVDRRDADALPDEGVYVESGEFGEATRRTPVPAGALRKFDHVLGAEAVYSNGAVVVYDLGALDAN